jgi:hypothetical protein
MIKSLFLLVIISTCLSAFAQDNENCRAKGALEIIKVLDKGLVLNDKFKKSVGGPDKDEYQRLRKEIEQYDEGTVMPCVRRASQLMAKQEDPVLMHKLMELVISHENSADETISYTMGKLFATNPVAVERALEQFPFNGRKRISDSIQTGWINVKPELSPALGKSRDERLKKLLSSVDRTE